MTDSSTDTVLAIVHDIAQHYATVARIVTVTEAYHWHIVQENAVRSDAAVIEVPAGSEPGERIRFRRRIGGTPRERTVPAALRDEIERREKAMADDPAAKARADAYWRARGLT